MKPILFLIDTGSPWTVISPYDALQLNIPTRVLTPAEDYATILLAGNSFMRLLLDNVGLRVKNEKGKVSQFNLSSIGILYPPKKASSKQFKGISSILGTDFLNSKKLGLYFNPSKNEAYLSK